MRTPGFNQNILQIGRLLYQLLNIHLLFFVDTLGLAITVSAII